MSSRHNFEKLGVLIIDDNAHMRLMLKSILNAFRFQTIKDAEDAATAFKMLQSTTVDFVIVDWHMEPLDGLDFIRLVRTAKDSPDPYLPIIMLTGHTEYSRVIMARDAGANEVMCKPVSPRGLYARIISIIEHPRPFVKAGSFFGPDRRRKNSGPPGGVEERRADVASDPTTRSGEGADLIELDI